MSPDESEDLKRDAAMFPIARLRELAKSANVEKKEAVDGSMAYVLSASAGAHAIERYYIDSASGLLLRRAIITTTLIGNIPDQIDYSDYRPVDGVKVPFTVKVAGVDPRDNMTQHFTTIEQNVKVDAKKFVMPDVKPRGR